MVRVPLLQCPVDFIKNCPTYALHDWSTVSPHCCIIQEAWAACQNGPSIGRFTRPNSTQLLYMPTQCLLTLVKCQDGNRFHWFRFQNWRKLLTVWDANENGSQFKVYDLESVFLVLNLLFLLHAGIRRQHGPIHGCQPSSEESHWNTIHPNYSSLLARRHCFKSWLLWMPVRQISCMHDLFLPRYSPKLLALDKTFTFWLRFNIFDVFLHLSHEFWKFVSKMNGEEFLYLEIKK